MKTFPLFLHRQPSPLCPLLVVTDRQGILRALEFADGEARMHRLLRAHYGSHSLEESAAPLPVREALGRYFEGEVDALNALPVASGGTPFQRAVWQALRTIPAGAVMTYGELSARLGRPAASRAVGAANRSNPICLVVPCHRVVGAKGALTGYAGGIARKHWLIEHERRFARSESSRFALSSI